MPPPLLQSALSVDVVKQYTGPTTVARRVVVDVPGKFFLTLTASEQREFYKGEPVEYKERHTFGQHNKAWGGFTSIHILCLGFRVVFQILATRRRRRIGHSGTLSKFGRRPGPVVADEIAAHTVVICRLCAYLSCAPANPFSSIP